MSDFFEKVYKVAKQIPVGRVTSYGAIAKYLGAAGSARMVGWAMNATRSQSEFVPAHRVVNSNGLLTGKHHFDSPNTMIELLENEGIELNGDQIVDFKLKFWDPQVELREEFSV
jgi:methylated-DNA-protein-cysteine methyltransferase-like protein